MSVGQGSIASYWLKGAAQPYVVDTFIIVGAARFHTQK